MKRVFLFLSAALALLLSSCFWGSSLLFHESDTLGKPNLVANPDFEIKTKQTDRLPVGWILNPSGLLLRETIVCDPTVCASGTQSLKIANTQRKLTLLTDPFRIDPWNGYLILASVKTTNPTGANVTLKFQTYADDGTITNNFQTSIKSGSEWKKGSISAGFIDKKATFARVLIVIPPTEDYPVWIDRVGCFSVHRFILD